ncbi:MAG: hypothetical protein KIS73_28350 [Enhydrobacter sp.]|nr:hypothetical protein [Enhydrobacter sp.]
MTRTLVGGLAVVLLASGGASAQEGTRAHMEGCLIWSGQGAVGVRNECSRPIALMFMILDDGEIVTTELSPGGRFMSDAQWGQSGGFIFTACPAGTRPNLRFAVENKEAIGLSLYNCVGGRPNS